MDSVSQFVLGASVGVLISPQKTPKVAIISGIIATIPDLDIFLDYGNDLLNTVNHRGFSHSFFYLTLFAPLLALLLVKSIKTLSFYRWWLLSWLVLITHIILDSLTIYGTALFSPLSEVRIMIGSIFVIDPLYTLPLLFSFLYLMVKKSAKFNTLGLVLSTLYLCWSLLAQSIVAPNGKGFATPTPFNTYLWRVVEIKDDYISQYFINIFGEKSKVRSIANNTRLWTDEHIEKYANFSSGFYNLKIENDLLILYDLRMGTIFHPAFSFVVAQKIDGIWQSVSPYRITSTRTLQQMFQ
jgi:inner membrane protein